LSARVSSGYARLATLDFRVGVSLLLVLALLARCALVAATSFDPSNAPDPADYDRHARSIARGDGYPETIYAPAGGPTAIRPPLYPYWLGAVYKLTGDQIRDARLGQALLGTLTVALIGLLAWQIWGRRTAIAALAIAAVFPPLLIWGASLLTEPLFLPLELATLAAAIEYRRRGHPRLWLVGTGVLAGLMILTRETGAVLLVPLAMAVWTDRPRFSLRAVAPPIALVAIAALTIAPWTIRNAVAMDSFIPVSTTSGYALSGIYNNAARSDHAKFRPPQEDPMYADLLARTELREPEVARKLGSRAVNYAADHPLYVLEAGFWNTIRMLHIDDLSYARATTRAIGLSSRVGDVGSYGFLVVGVLAVLGAFSRSARRAPSFVWLSPLFLATVVFGGSAIRYRAPIDPFVVLLAALGVVSALTSVAEKRGAQAPAHAGPASRPFH
jgi:4-amino-4-deoxy-L-arabinose transferase-like glycosyltransferase